MGQAVETSRARRCARTAQVAVVLSAVLLAGACTTSTAGAPSAATTGPSTTRLAPPLTQPPLDLTAQKADPCSLLEPTQLARYGITSAGRAKLNDITGPSCTWNSSTLVGLQVMGSVNTATGGLEQLYLRRAGFLVFDPTTVASYPAVSTSVSEDSGLCNLSAGVNNTDLLEVTLITPFPAPAGYEDPCARAAEALASMIANAG